MSENRNPNESTPKQLPPQLRRELDPLKQRYAFRWDPEDQAVIVDDVELPTDWTPRVIEARIEIPRTYPQTAPRVALPWTIRCNGVVPRHMLVAGNWMVRGKLGDRIYFWPTSWEQSATLADILEELLDDLTRMSKATHKQRNGNSTPNH